MVEETLSALDVKEGFCRVGKAIVWLSKIIPPEKALEILEAAVNKICE